MFVSVTKNPGGPDGGGHFGLRVPLADRKEFFDRKWTEVEVEIDGKFHRFTLRPGFWKNTSVIRDHEGDSIIGEWLKRHRITEWTSGAPHRVTLVPLDRNRFRLVA